MAEVWNHQFAEVNGVRLHYVRHGGGKPVLLVHGWPGFWFEWSHTIPALAERFDVVARIEHDTVLLDPRTVHPREDRIVIEALRSPHG